MLWGDFPILFFFVFNLVLLLFCYLFALISWKITFAQSSSAVEEGKKNILKFTVSLNSLKFYQNKLKTLSQSLRRYCAMDFMGGPKYINLFITFTQYVYITNICLKTFPNILYIKPFLNPIKLIKTIITIFFDVLV